jgi:hypothetical protein
MATQFMMAGIVFAAASAVFGAATADAVVVDSNTVEYVVSVEALAGTSVVLHALDPGSEQVTVAMLENSSGVYRTRFESRPVDYIIVFEDLTSGEQSDPRRLSELGVAPEFVGGTPSLTTSEEAGPDRSLGWLGLGLGLASLSVLAFWVLAGDRQSEQPAAEEPDDVSGAAEGVLDESVIED